MPISPIRFFSGSNSRSELELATLVRPPPASFFDSRILGVISNFLSLKEGMEARSTCRAFRERLITKHSGSHAVSLKEFRSIKNAIKVLGTLHEAGYMIHAMDLNLHYFTTDAQLAAVAATCPDIHTMHLALYRPLTDAFFRALRAACPHIHTLKFSFCDHLTDASLTAIGAAYPNLQTIELLFCSKFTDASLRKLGAACPNLQKINLSFNDQITDAGLIALRAACAHIQIDISGCKQITDAGRAVFGKTV